VARAQDLARPAAEPAAVDVDAVLKRAKLGLKDSDPQARRRALEELGRLGPAASPAVPLMVEALDDHEPETRRLAAQAEDADAEVRGRAVLGLTGLGRDAPDAAGSLLAILRRGSEVERQRAAQALARIGKPALQPLIETLKNDKDSGARAAAAFALGQMGPLSATALPDLTAALRDGEERVRGSSASALARLGPAAKGAIPPLVEMVSHDAHPGAAIEALGAIGPAARDAVPALIAVLKDEKKEATTRASAATAIPRIAPADRQVIPALVEGMRTANFGLANMCQNAVTRFGPAAIPALKGALREGRGKGRERLVATLSRVGQRSPDLLPILSAALHDDDPAVRREAAVGLAGRGRSALPSLLDSAKGDDPGGQAAAVFGLSLVSPPPAEARQALLAALKDKDAEVRSAAGVAVGRVTARAPMTERASPAAGDAVPALIEVAKGGKSRAAAIHSLGQIGPAAGDAVPALTDVLRAGDVADRQASASALAQIGDPAVPALVEALRDKDAPVRALAASALGMINLTSHAAANDQTRTLAPKAVSALADALED
jgi:HEAT repeat protein